MKKIPLIPSLIAPICALLAAIPASANTVISVNFSSPTTLLQSADAVPRTLGGTGTYSMGTWVYSAVGAINVSSSGVAQIRNNSANNPRAIAVIFAASNFTAGTEYTVSFDVNGHAAGDDSGRYWLAEASGYSGSGSIITNVAQGTSWATAAKPFTTSGTGASLNFLQDSVSNGVLITGENVAGTSSIAFNFTYSAGKDIAFAVGTYNNQFSIDNFTITAIPEPSTYAAMAGVLALAGVVWHRARRTRRVA